MKKILFLAFAVLLLLNCTDQNGLERASKNQLSKFLSSNASYKKFIDAHYKNTLLLASLDVNQSKRVEDLSRNIFEDTDVESVRKKSKMIYDLSGMNPETIRYYFSFINDLRYKFVFDENDLLEVIQVDLKALNNEMQITNGRSEEWFSSAFEYACGIWCGEQTREKVGDMDDSYQKVYYAGCLNGCVFGPKD